METEVKRIDECEGSVEFSGKVIITWERKTEFLEKLKEIVGEYAI